MVIWQKEARLNDIQSKKLFGITLIICHESPNPDKFIYSLSMLALSPVDRKILIKRRTTVLFLPSETELCPTICFVQETFQVSCIDSNFYEWCDSPGCVSSTIKKLSFESYYSFRLASTEIYKSYMPTLRKLSKNANLAIKKPDRGKLVVFLPDRGKLVVFLWRYVSI